MNITQTFAFIQPNSTPSGEEAIHSVQVELLGAVRSSDHMCPSAPLWDEHWSALEGQGGTSPTVNLGRVDRNEVVTQPTQLAGFRI